jgi:hypothetical protein
LGIPGKRENPRCGPAGSRAGPFLNFIFRFCGLGVVPGTPDGRNLATESAMQRTFIIAVMVVGITAANAQTMVQPNGQTTSNNVGSDPLSVSASSLPSVSSPSTGSVSGSMPGPGSTTSNGTSGAGPGATSAVPSTSPQAPLQLPGEKPDTSMQGASTTATASGPASPICPPPVPSSDGGSANLSGIAGGSLNGC